MGQTARIMKRKKRGRSPVSKEVKYNIFVYGTLMRGERAHSFLAGAKYLGEYCLKDYALYNLGRYPGIRPLAGGTVYGEVYEIDAGMLPEMDAYEGEGSLYFRTELTAGNENGTIKALAYVYAHEVAGRRIEGGNWKTRKT